MTIHSLHIGINDYQGRENDLAGCVNDARDLHALVADVAASRVLLLDGKATRRAILAAMATLLQGLRPGDLGFVTFSGHGTYVPDRSGDEPDRRDEALVCADLQLIIDDEFRGILSARHRQSKVLVLTDSCHSGSVHRGIDRRPLRQVSAYRPRYLSPAAIPSISRFAAEQRPRYHAVRKGREQAALPLVAHFAGCRDDEYSYDAIFDGRGNGAFTHYLLQARRALGPAAELGDWFDEVALLVGDSEYPQTPVLNASAAVRRWPVPF